MSTVVLDTRDPIGPEKGKRHGFTSFDKNDRRTIDDLRAANTIPSTIAVNHRRDDHLAGLWVADVAAYAVARSLATADPTRLIHLAERLELHEARAIPPAQRDAHSRAVEPTSGLELRLAEHLVAAQRAAAQTPPPPGETEADRVALRQRAEALDARLQTALTVFERDRRRPPKPLADYLDQERR
ncbi:MAG: hypothetical protein LBM23_07770 [Propionibacteriaceae bacterium]|nr:hypothetical protein [Propionibacteriaceae bacterium]